MERKTDRLSSSLSRERGRRGTYKTQSSLRHPTVRVERKEDIVQDSKNLINKTKQKELLGR